MEVLNPLLGRLFRPQSPLRRIQCEQALQAGGRRFDPGTLHYTKCLDMSGFYFRSSPMFQVRHLPLVHLLSIGHLLTQSLS
jgi:hypothetical protein